MWIGLGPSGVKALDACGDTVASLYRLDSRTVGLRIFFQGLGVWDHLSWVSSVSRPQQGLSLRVQQDRPLVTKQLPQVGPLRGEVFLLTV